MLKNLISAVLIACTTLALPVLAADNDVEKTKRKPDLADAVEGTWVGDVTSDSKGSSKENVTLTLTRVGKNLVRIESDYSRLPVVEVPLQAAMSSIISRKGDTAFALNRAKRPPTLDVSFHNEVSWAGVRR